MIIGLHGYKTSGKDTFYAIFTFLNLKIEYENIKFASKLKNICSIITGLPLCYFTDKEYVDFFLEDWNLSVRQLMQKIGTEVFRETLNKDTWVISTFADYKEDDNWIITDLRFPNELEAIKKRNGILIKIEKPNVEKTDTHISEHALDYYKDWDYIIINDGTIDDYKEKILEVSNDIKIKRSKN